MSDMSGYSTSLLLMTALLFCVVFAGESAAQQGKAEASRMEPLEPDRAEEPAVPPEETEREDQRRVATVAVLLLGGIAFVGCMLVGLVVLWGFRVRRVVRAPLRRQSQPDELWYLKPNNERSIPRSVERSDEKSNDNETQS